MTAGPSALPPREGTTAGAGGALRVLVACANRRHAGGVEVYLEALLPALRAAGHEVALLAEHDAPAARTPLAVPADVPTWVGAEGAAAADALAAARAWRPDVTYLNGFAFDDRIGELSALAPVVYFPHEYAGSCISGFKTHQSVPRPCGRPLGPGCLAHFYPHRCGGLNPLTMARQYRGQRRRQRHLRRFAAVAAGSEHMSREMIRGGVAPHVVHRVPYLVPDAERLANAGAAPCAPLAPHGVARLLFVGRLEALKGGALLVDATAEAARRLERPLHLTFAGDGPERADWEARARAASAAAPVTFEFAGWAAGADLEALWRSASLLVVPSIWPEPFGMVGAEAGLRGMPAAAFAVGGIGEWLEDGVNGHLAPGDGPLRPGAFAIAIERCLADVGHWRALHEAAPRLAARFRLDPHVAALEGVLRRAAGGASAAGASARRPAG